MAKNKYISIPAKTANMFAKIAKILNPPPDINIAEWADMYRYLARGTSAEPGRWRTDRNPHQRAIMEAIADKNVSKVVVKSSAQIGKTEIILNTLAYYIDHKPAPILLLQPTVELVKKFSKKRIAGMVEATPRLQNKIKSAKSRDADNTILNKKFPGGFLTLVGANASSGLASEPIKIVLCDEVDRYPESADKEGDPVSLAEARTSTFWDRKIVLMSTPTNEETSRINMEYNSSSQSEYCLPCPYCQKLQPIVFRQIDFKTLEHKCVYCNDSAGEQAWKNGKGEYISKYPDNPVKGFHINALMVNLGNDWGMIVNQFLKAKQNTQTLKVFVNTVLGECWNDSSEEIDHQALYNLRENYEAELPEGVLFLTAGVDVQDNRLEVEVCGWGKGFETWGIEYKQILGNPRFDEVWDQLDNYIKKEFLFKDGNGLSIACTCVDSGYETKNVYKWVKHRENRNIFCIKGDNGWGRPIVARSGNRNDFGVKTVNCRR